MLSCPNTLRLLLLCALIGCGGEEQLGTSLSTAAPEGALEVPSEARTPQALGHLVFDSLARGDAAAMATHGLQMEDGEVMRQRFSRAEF